ncbi:MAG: 54S ribosomal protein L2 mitochondrial [Piccolia ochrophora]|nr:MAG: 54S ribosomal protein L2 mitochondrial [Piccolia ochrophora]
MHFLRIRPTRGGIGLPFSISVIPYPTFSLSPTYLLPSVRHASHAAQASKTTKRNGPGKRLGAKKTGGQYVQTGNILFRQRGTTWFPGFNAALGRDHTVYAMSPGYVRYYRDPALHPKRQYIGVALAPDDPLPPSPQAPRRRRLGMFAAPLRAPEGEQSAVAEGALVAVQRLGEVSVRGVVMGENRQMGGKGRRTVGRKSDGSYREANWEIGMVGDAAKGRTVRAKGFKPRDRWAAWRKANKRKAANAERRGLRAKRKAK